MNWICPRCQNELGELNGWCEYCKQSDGVIVYNPDKYFIREIRINHLISGASKMTPQEELFADLFNGYKTKPSVQSMTDLELRAHREDLCKIALEAKAYIYAVDDILKERKPKGPQGFAKSINTDETTTNAINVLKEKQKRVSKAEQIRAGLLKLGLSSDVADKLMSAKNMLSEVNKVQNTDKTDLKDPTGPPAFNPFKKKQ